MKFTLSWLNDYLATSAPLDEIVERLVQIGLEVEHVDNPAEALAAFTVAKVKDAKPHPDADRLQICTVETVDGEKQIVCGAPNARAGMTAVYAPLGTYIPGLDFTLDKKPRKIRGVESHGMLCSAKELGAGEDHDGIADLDAALPLGMPAADALGVNDPVIDVEITPNRPDWLGVHGIARDLAPTGIGGLIDEGVKKIAGKFDCPVEIALEATEACPVFAGVLIRGVKNGPSPDWMQARLRAVGISPKSLLIDVTNYVSLDRARPLHAYDADKLKGTVKARYGKTGEKLKALDGKTYSITEEMCVIADSTGAIGLGGVMGGTSTAVSDETENVFLESAWFDPKITAKTGRATAIVSDARYRFERGVDPQSCMMGLNFALALITEYGGGAVSKAKMVGDPPLNQSRVEFLHADVARLTGLTTKPATMKKTLKALGFDIEDSGEIWHLTAPSWRFDMAQSADIVEEITRIEGYDALPTRSLPTLDAGSANITTPQQRRIRTIRRAMAARGFNEAVTWSFMLKEHSEHFGGGDAALTLSNPVASELNQMRPSILPNLAIAAQKAVNHGAREVRMFEAGPIYLGDGPKDQRSTVAALVRPSAQRHWRSLTGYDAYSAKADLFATLEAIGQPPARFQLDAPRQSHWHPGKSACLKLGPKVTIAHFGALHPRALKALDVDGPVFAFELNLNAVPYMKARSTKTRSVLERSELLPSRRDFAFVVEQDTPAGQIAKAAKGADQKLISEVGVFDVYAGQGIEDGKKSVAIEVTIQPTDENLTDAKIEEISSKVIAAVKKATGGDLRG